MLTDEIHKILKVNDSYKTPARLLELIFGDEEELHEVFIQMADLFGNKYDFDWFHEYFQEENAQRKTNKQDFTPHSLSVLMNRLADIENDGSTYFESAAGTGGILIDRWHQDRIKHSPIFYKPSMYFYYVEEYSDRALPYLLFNMMIRGMNGCVIHGDSLTGEAFGAFFVHNEKDIDGFSKLKVLPYREFTEKELNITFVEERYKEYEYREKTRDDD